MKPNFVEISISLRTILSKTLLVPALMVLLLASCHDYKPDIAKLEGEKEGLSADVAMRDSTIANFIEEVNTIESNLAAIDTSKRHVTTSTANPELRKTQLVRINENIDNIKNLMQENRDRIANLNKRLKAAGVKNASLEKLMATMNMQIAEKDSQLTELNTAIIQLNSKISDQQQRINELSAQNMEIQKVVADQKSQLNTAYYIIGTSKKLIEKGVLTKEGGFIGIGRTKVMKGDYNNSGFTQIDITEQKTFPLEVKEAKILTTHPTTSYTIQRKDKKHVTALEITKPEEFWKTSKYLVVTVEK